MDDAIEFLREKFERGEQARRDRARTSELLMHKLENAPEYGRMDEVARGYHVRGGIPARRPDSIPYRGNEE